MAIKGKNHEKTKEEKIYKALDFSVNFTNAKYILVNRQIKRKKLTWATAH